MSKITLKCSPFSKDVADATGPISNPFSMFFSDEHVPRDQPSDPPPQINICVDKWYSQIKYQHKYHRIVARNNSEAKSQL